MTVPAFLLALFGVAASVPQGDPLTLEVQALDADLFGAYNRCDLDTFGSYFDPRVAFYHDAGGATFDRDTVISNTRKFICGKVRRELVSGTLRAYPVKNFGAIQEGEHRFCELATGRCEGIAKFVIVWAKRDANWRVTTDLSYGHREATAAEQEAATVQR